jgi:hypothetical protein
VTLAAAPKVREAAMRLRGNSDMEVLTEWLKQETSTATRNFIKADSKEFLPVLQNSVRLLERITVVISGEDA